MPFKYIRDKRREIQDSWGLKGCDCEYCTAVEEFNTKYPDVYEVGILELVCRLASSQPLS